MSQIINTWPLDVYQNKSTPEEKEIRLHAQESGELYTNGTLSYDSENLYYDTKAATFTAPLKDVIVIYRRKNKPLPVVHDFFIQYGKHRHPLTFPDNSVETEKNCVEELRKYGIRVQYDFKYLLKDLIMALLLLGIFAFVLWYF